MKGKILSLSKNEDFRFLLNGKKISNKYLTIFYKRLSNKNKNNLNISFVTQKKLGNAVLRNKVKRRLKSIMNQLVKISKINFNYSYLFIVKKSIINAKFVDIKETIINDYKKIK